MTACLISHRVISFQGDRNATHDQHEAIQGVHGDTSAESVRNERRDSLEDDLTDVLESRPKRDVRRCELEHTVGIGDRSELGYKARVGYYVPDGVGAVAGVHASKRDGETESVQSPELAHDLRFAVGRKRGRQERPRVLLFRSGGQGLEMLLRATDDLVLVADYRFVLDLGHCCGESEGGGA